MGCTTKRIEQEREAGRPVWLMGQHGSAIRFASVADAAKRTGFPAKRIRDCCELKARIGDLVFRFMEEQG
jgi:hypothetical protein